ncbi:MAG: hypothetical protein P1P59_06910 [Treponemataceae bacterium]
MYVPEIVIRFLDFESVILERFTVIVSLKIINFGIEVFYDRHHKDAKHWD